MLDPFAASPKADYGGEMTSTRSRLVTTPLSVGDVREMFDVTTTWRRLVPLSFVLATSAIGLGCGPRWTVVRQAVPDPFLNQRDFFIEPVHSEGVRVGEKSEAVYLADKTPDQGASWQTDKADMISQYAEGLMAAGEGMKFTMQPGPTIFIVRPILVFVEPGFYVGVAAHATEVTMRVELLSPAGQPLDVISIESAIAASAFNAASGTRLRQAAHDLGGVTADYLKKRVSSP
jgi:hypothetical protein